MKIGFILLAFISMGTTQISKAWGQDQATPVTITNEIFTVPGPTVINGVLQNKGIERPFSLTNESTVTLIAVSKRGKPALNVYLLDADNYSKYQTSGSLTNLATVGDFTKLGTLGFEKTAILQPGKYVVIIKWAKSGLFTKAPPVSFELVAQAKDTN